MTSNPGKKREDGDDPAARRVWSSEGIPPAAPTPSGATGPSPVSQPAGPARVRLERQGRGGKVVTVVENLPGHPEAIEKVAKVLKARCGAGGTVKGRVVEVQGDHRDRAVAVLASMGITAKRAGG